MSITRSLRAPGAVLLVSCYELGRPPLGVRAPLGFFRRAGYAPRCLDLAVEALDEEAIRAAHLVAFSAPMHTALRLGVRAARRVKEINPAARIVFYGLYALMNQEHLLSQGIAHACIGGELEEELLACAEEPQAEGAPAPRQPALTKLDFPPFPSEGLPPLERYAALERGGARLLAGAVESTRGCKHRCRHCPIPPVYGGRFFVVPVESVLATAEAQIRAGARHLSFGDPDFLNGPKHALRVARALHAAHPEVTFDVTAKVEHLVEHAAALPALAELGCLLVISAVESLSPEVLAHLDKNHTRDDVDRALEATRAAGVHLRPTFVPFTPWTTRADILELIEWVAARGLIDHVDPVQYTIRLLVPPGSLLAEHPGMTPHMGPLDAPNFSYAWSHPDPAMDALQVDFAAAVQAGSRRGEDPEVTFLTLRALAHEGGASPLPLAPLDPARPRPPRLTEDWFC